MGSHPCRALVRHIPSRVALSFVHIFLRSRGGSFEQGSMRHQFAALSPERRGALTFAPEFAVAMPLASNDPSG